MNGAQTVIPGVGGAVAVVTHDEDLPLGDFEMGAAHVAAFLVHLLQGVVLLQGLAVHIDGAGAVVDVHALAAGGNDALDDGGLTQEIGGGQ